MPDRLRLVDAVCAFCKRVLSRQDLAGETPEDIIQIKAQIMAEGLIPFEFYSDNPKPIAGSHLNSCPKAPQ